MNKVWQLILMHFREFSREPEILFWALFFPIATAWVLGVAFTDTGAETVNVAVVSEKKQFSSLKESLSPGKAKTRVKFQLERASREKAVQGLKRGSYAALAIYEAGVWQIQYAPGNRQGELAYLTFNQRFSKPTKKVKAAAVSGKGQRYIDFLVPGLMALGVMNSCLWGVGYLLIEFRMKKLLRRVIATPLEPWHFLLSQFATRVGLSGLESILLFAFCYFYFDFAIQGSVPGFLVLFISGVFFFSGLGILIGSRARTTRLGNGLINAITLPFLVLSGIFFSYRNFPESIQPVLEQLPLALMTDGFRGLANEAWGITAILPASALLILYGVVLFVVGLKIFRWH